MGHIRPLANVPSDHPTSRSLTVKVAVSASKVALAKGSITSDEGEIISHFPLPTNLAMVVEGGQSAWPVVLAIYATGEIAPAYRHLPLRGR